MKEYLLRFETDDLAEANFNRVEIILGLFFKNVRREEGAQGSLFRFEAEEEDPKEVLNKLADEITKDNGMWDVVLIVSDLDGNEAKVSARIFRINKLADFKYSDNG